MSIQISSIEGGVRFEVHVQPRSSRNQIVGEQDGRVKVKLAAPPVDGEANQTLISFISDYLSVPKRNTKIIRGETSRHKLLEIRGLTERELIAKLKL